MNMLIISVVEISEQLLMCCTTVPSAFITCVKFAIYLMLTILKVHREKKQTIHKSKLNLTILMSIYCGRRGHVHIIACWTSKHILLHIQIKLIEKNELDIALWPRVPYPFQCSNNLNAFAGSHVVFVAIIAIDVDVNVSDAFSFCFRLRILALGSSRHW